jgi:hypothetical protein
MRRYHDLEKGELRDLLGKGWLSHDGTWFLSTAGQYGIEDANRLNKSAIHLLAPLEMRRSRELLLGAGEELKDIESVVEFVLESLRLVMPSSVSGGFRVSYPSLGVIHWEWYDGGCFAYKGMRHFGFLDGYHCGVIYRIECWLEALGMTCETSPPITTCIMHSSGACSGEFHVSFS